MRAWLKRFWSEFVEASFRPPLPEEATLRTLFKKGSRRRDWDKEVADEVDYFADVWAPKRKPKRYVDPPTVLISVPVDAEDVEWVDLVDGWGNVVRQFPVAPARVRRYVLRGDGGSEEIVAFGDPVD